MLRNELFNNHSVLCLCQHHRVMVTISSLQQVFLTTHVWNSRNPKSKQEIWAEVFNLQYYLKKDSLTPYSKSTLLLALLHCERKKSNRQSVFSLSARLFFLLEPGHQIMWMWLGNQFSCCLAQSFLEDLCKQRRTSLKEDGWKPVLTMSFMTRDIKYYTTAAGLNRSFPADE